MDIVSTLVIYALISGLFLGMLFWTLLGLSLSLLFILFIIISIVSFTSLLTVTPILFISLLVIIPLLMVSMISYFLWQYYPHYIHWIKYYCLEKPKHYFQRYYFASLHTLPKQSILQPIYYLLLGGIGMAILATGVLTNHVLQGSSLTQWNLPMYYAMLPLRSPQFDGLWVKISLFNSLVMAIFWGIISVYFLLKKDNWRAIHWILLGLLMGIFTVGLKYSTAIPRPGVIFSVRDAFPSAHMSTHMTLLGGLILLLDLNKGITLWRWLTYLVYGIWLYLIAFSRLYLAAHWFTDIIGGILISLISLGLFSLSYYRRVSLLSSRSELVLMSLGSLSSLWLIRFILTYDKILAFYTASF